MTLYVIELKTRFLMARVDGDSTFECERKALAWGGLAPIEGEIFWSYVGSGFTDDGTALEID